MTITSIITNITITITIAISISIITIIKFTIITTAIYLFSAGRPDKLRAHPPTLGSDIHTHAHAQKGFVEHVIITNGYRMKFVNFCLADARVWILQPKPTFSALPKSHTSDLPTPRPGLAVTVGNNNINHSDNNTNNDNNSKKVNDDNNDSHNTNKS